MTLYDNVSSNFYNVMAAYGMPYKQYLVSGGSFNDYDEATFSTIGSTIGSCFFIPVSERMNGEDYQYLQEGAIKRTDFKIFMPSGPISENDTFMINAGSYSVLKWSAFTLQGKILYNKIYVRSVTA